MDILEGPLSAWILFVTILVTGLVAAGWLAHQRWAPARIVKAIVVEIDDTPASVSLVDNRGNVMTTSIEDCMQVEQCGDTLLLLINTGRATIIELHGKAKGTGA